MLRVCRPAPFVAHIELNRPAALNAFNDACDSIKVSMTPYRMFAALRNVVNEASLDPQVRAIVLSGGDARHFTAGLDCTLP
jgi:delta(3,5)-delta(2,4)-dienoyl-CoA isomerase